MGFYKKAKEKAGELYQHYGTRPFKKYTGMTKREVRHEIQRRKQQRHFSYIDAETRATGEDLKLIQAHYPGGIRKGHKKKLVKRRVKDLGELVTSLAAVLLIALGAGLIASTNPTITGYAVLETGVQELLSTLVGFGLMLFGIVLLIRKK